MLREGQEVRMVTGTTEGSKQSGSSYGGRGTRHAVPREEGEQDKDQESLPISHAARKATLLLTCPDKVTPKETPEINMISLTVSVNVVTRSQSKLMIEDASDLSTTKAKGKQIVKDELAEQRQLAAKLTEEFAKMKPEQPESSSTRQITKIAPKPCTNQKKASVPSFYKYVQK